MHTLHTLHALHAKLELRQEYERKLVAAADDGSAAQHAAEDSVAALRAERERALKGARDETLRARAETEALRARLDETNAGFLDAVAALSQENMREKIEDKMQVLWR